MVSMAGPLQVRIRAVSSSRSLRRQERVERRRECKLGSERRQRGTVLEQQQVEIGDTSAMVIPGGKATWGTSGPGMVIGSREVSFVEGVGDVLDALLMASACVYRLFSGL